MLIRRRSTHGDTTGLRALAASPLRLHQTASVLHSFRSTARMLFLTFAGLFITLRGGSPASARYKDEYDLLYGRNIQYNLTSDHKVRKALVHESLF